MSRFDEQVRAKSSQHMKLSENILGQDWDSTATHSRLCHTSGRRENSFAANIAELWMQGAGLHQAN